MKKILYVGSFELPDKNAAALRVYYNSLIFKELGYEVVFLGVNSEQKNKTLIKTKIGEFDVYTYKYPRNLKEWVNYTFSVKNVKEIIHKIGNISMIVLYDYPAIPNIKLLKLCKKKGIRIIGDCVEWPTTRGGSLIRKIVKSFDIFLRMRIVNKKNDGLILISKYLDSYYKKQKSIILPPLNDIKYIDMLDFDKAKKKESTLFFSGSIGENKERLDLVVKAIISRPDLKRINFLIAGISKNDYIKIYGPIREDDRIKFLGRISHKEVVEKIKGSKYGMLIRDKNRKTMAGFSTKLTEYISYGTYVICSDTSDVKKYIFNDVNGYVVNCNIQEISNLLEKINNDLDLYSKKMNIEKKDNPFYYKHYLCPMEDFFKKIYS